MKEEIRKESIVIRKQIPNKEEKSHIICEKIKQHPKYLEAKDVLLYKGLKDEVSLEELISYSFQNGKRVYVPKVVGDDLEFYEIQENEQYVKSPFHVLEPVGDSSKKMKKMDLILVPGVAFDKKLHRMGFGKGYYDRFLKDKKIYKIGLKFLRIYEKNLLKTKLKF